MTLYIFYTALQFAIISIISVDRCDFKYSLLHIIHTCNQACIETQAAVCNMFFPHVFIFEYIQYKNISFLLEEVVQDSPLTYQTFRLSQ